MLEEAIGIAKTNPTDLPKMAAIIAKRGRVLSVGMNSRKTHPIVKRFSTHDLKNCLHAETDALKNAIKEHGEDALMGAEIFVARVMKNGSTGIAKPCNACQTALNSFGIVAVHWTEYEN